MVAARFRFRVKVRFWFRVRFRVKFRVGTSSSPGVSWPSLGVEQWTGKLLRCDEQIT